MCLPANSSASPPMPTTTSVTNTHSNGKHEKISTKETPSKYNHYHPTTYFRLGRLRYGFHGICATMAMSLDTVALYQQLTAANNITTPSSSSHTDASSLPPPHFVLLCCCILFNSITAWDARNLLEQVPLKTEIFPGIVAPHREAFKRTMAMMHYNSIRIAGQLCVDVQATAGYKILAGLFAWYYFFPVNSDFTNGNTWIFVVPMFVGVTLDMMQLVLCEGSVLQLPHYLFVEWSCLWIAFCFTLAFRGYISIAKIYVYSALYVAALLVGGCYYALVMTAHSSPQNDNHDFATTTTVNDEGYLTASTSSCPVDNVDAVNDSICR